MGETRGTTTTTAVRAEHDDAGRFGYGAQCVLAGVVVALLMLAVTAFPVGML